METPQGGPAIRTHGTQSRSMLLCRFENRAFEIYGHIVGLVQGRVVILPDDTVPIRKFDSHSRRQRSGRTIINSDD